MNNKKIEVGMYIRTYEGIRKIINEYDEGYELDKSLHYLYPEGHDLYKEDLEEDIDEIIIGEPSFDIIDLIEVGDYINGREVVDINETYSDGTYTNKYKYVLVRPNIETIKNKEIKSIVTKEQFENCIYRIGE